MRWNRWQCLTLLALTVGYAGYYVCRSNLSIASPLLQQEGFTKAQVGSIASAGVLTYAIGKILNGVLGDFIGGRVMFLLAIAASAIATVAFGFSSGLIAFTVIWCINRFVQSAGWGAAMKITGNWFTPEQYGRAVGILSLSYLFGDVAARLILGRVIREGATWQEMFFVAAGILGAIGLFVLVVLRNRPQDVGLEPVVASTTGVFGAEGDCERPDSLLGHLAPFLRSVSFWFVCLLSFGLTLIRETFNLWTPTYLVEAAGLSNSRAAEASALFPFFGGLSVIAAGYLSDTVAKGRRAGVICLFLIPGAIVMTLLGTVAQDSSTAVKLVLVSAAGFLIIGPYSFLAGSISLDIGSKRGVATSAGIVDAVGYLAGILSGRYVGTLAQDHGWTHAFGFLAIVALLSAVAAAAYWVIQERSKRRAEPQ